MHLITFAIIAVFGGATLLLEDELFIKWKPTVLNWIFGVVLLGSQFFGKKTLIERMMSTNIQLPSPVWTKLNWSWAVFFIGLGIVNLFVVYHYDTDTWVNFKLFGMLGLTLLFVFAQAIYMARHVQEPTKVNVDE
jgi:intracellular septation protein